MANRDSFVQKKKVSRTMSLLDNSFKMGASLLQAVSSNKSIHHLNLQNIKFIDKQKFQEKDECQICFISFTKINRRHHCRTCGKTCCSECCSSTVNKQKVCDICISHYLQPNKSLLKDGLLQRLKINALQYLSGKLFVQEQLKKLTQQTPNKQKFDEEKKNMQKNLQLLTSKLAKAKNERQCLQEQLNKLKSQGDQQY